MLILIWIGNSVAVSRFVVNEVGTILQQYRNAQCQRQDFGVAYKEQAYAHFIDDDLDSLLLVEAKSCN